MIGDRPLRRRIAGVDLARYAEPVLPGNRGAPWRIAWHVVSALCCAPSAPGSASAW